MASLLNCCLSEVLVYNWVEFSSLCLRNKIHIQTDIQLEGILVMKTLFFRLFVSVRRMFGFTSNHSCSRKELDFKMRWYSNSYHSILDFDIPVFKQGRMHQCINLLEVLTPCLITNLVCGWHFLHEHPFFFFLKLSSTILVSISRSLQ